MDGKLRSHSSAVPGGRSAPQIPLVAFVCWPRVTRFWKRQPRRGTHPAVRRCGVVSSLQFLGFIESCTSGSDLKPKKKKEKHERWGWSPVLAFFRPAMSPHSSQQNGGPADWAEPRSTYVCKNCSQMFYTEKGLSSHMCFHSDQWPSPRGQREQQVKGAHRAFGVSGGRSVAGDWMSSTPGWRCTPEWSLGTGGGQEPGRAARSLLPTVRLKEPSIVRIQEFGVEFCRPPRQVPRPEGDGQSPPGAKKSPDSPAVAPLAVPASLPAAPVNRPPGSTAKVGAGQSARFLPAASPPAGGGCGESPNQTPRET